MEYKFSQKENFEDFASGRVIYGNGGAPNFPVRLAVEIFSRCLSFSEVKDKVIFYDPCCGGGYLLTVLGFSFSKEIAKLIGSDIDKEILSLAKKNLSLLTREGLTRREEELLQLISLYGKESHRMALESLSKLRKLCGLNGEKASLSCEFSCDEEKREICSNGKEGFLLFQADACRLPSPLPGTENGPDIIFTDVPYGNLVSWKDNQGQQIEKPLESLLDSLFLVSKPATVLAICTENRQKPFSDKWHRMESTVVGKRRFTIMKRE